MKKRILAMLLSALLVANVCACNQATENEIDNSEDLAGNEVVDDTNASATKNAYESYDSIISEYRKTVELRFAEQAAADKYFSQLDNEKRELSEKIYSSVLSIYPSGTDGKNENGPKNYGYTIKDLNGDGVDELILRRDNHQIIAIFTMVDKKPVLLKRFWNRKECWIDPDGYLHISGSSGADQSMFQIYRISNQTGELVLLVEGGTDGYDQTNGGTLYYKLVNNEKVYITSEEYDIWENSLPYVKFEATAILSEYLPFVPLFDQNHPVPDPVVQNPQEKG